jgi:hypothetical protein
MNPDTEDGREYYLDPTPEQLELIESLIDELPSDELDRLLGPSWSSDWSSSIDFWLKSWGRAEDLIGTLETILNKEGAT